MADMSKSVSEAYIVNSWSQDPKFRIRRMSGTSYMNYGSSYATTSAYVFAELKPVGKFNLSRTQYYWVDVKQFGSWVSQISKQKIKAKDIEYTVTFGASFPVTATSASDTGYGIYCRIKYQTDAVAGFSSFKSPWYEFVIPTPAPFTPANASGSSGSVSVPSSTYNIYSYKVSASGSMTANNSSVKWRLLRGSTVIDEQSGSSYSYSFYDKRGNGTYTYYLQYNYTNHNGSWVGWTTKDSDSITIFDPPPSKPDMGDVNNTTPSSVDTSVNKKISASWTLNHNGRLSTSFTAKAYKKNRDTGAVSEIYSYSGTNTSASASINLALNENVDIYWIVTATNSLGSDSTTSGSVRVHRIYTEPTNISSVSVLPTSVMMVNGTTSQLYSVSVNVNAWGDRPGTKELVIFQCYDGTKKTEVFRKTETGTGNVKMQFTASVDESYFGNHLRFLVEKRMGGAVYNGTTAYTGYVNMYETKAVLSGSATMSRSTITVGKELTVTYNYNYKKYSSEKVQFILELFNETLNTVVNSWTLQTKTADATYTGSQKIVPFTSDGEQDHKYVIRLKSVVTELLGNQTTTILGSSPLQYNYPPIVQLTQSGSIPMNANGSIIRFDSDITYSANVIYKDTIDHSEVILKTSQGEFKGTLVNGKWTWDNPGELTLNSKPEAFVRVYYDLGGTIETYDSPKYTIQVIPTRYIVYHTDNLVQEMRNPKLHLKISAGDEGYATKFQLTQG